MRQHFGSCSGRGGTDSPFWVPGEVEREVRERLEEGVTSFTVTCRRGSAPLLEVSAGLIARAFAAGDWETCGACLAEGLAARGKVFATFAEHVTSPAWWSRVDSPHWVPSVAHRQMYAGICGTVPYRLGAYDALGDELLEREKCPAKKPRFRWSGERCRARMRLWTSGRRDVRDSLGRRIVK